MCGISRGEKRDGEGKERKKKGRWHIDMHIETHTESRGAYTHREREEALGEGMQDEGLRCLFTQDI